MSKRSWCLFSLVAVGLLGAAGCGRSEPGAGGPPQANSTQVHSERKTDQHADIPVDQLGPILEAHYRGVGFMERFQYEESAKAFGEVYRRAPQWIPASINLAIALIYRGDPRSEVEIHATEEQALDLLARDPINPHAHYCRGVILARLGLLGRAHADFQAVVDQDPNDAHAWYMLGSTLRVPEPGDLVRGGDVEKTPEKRNDQQDALLRQTACLQRALQCDPYLVTARYKLAMAYRKAGDTEEFRKQLSLYAAFGKEINRNRPVEEFNTRYYGDMGRYAQLINPTVEPRSPAIPTWPVRFDSPVPLKIRLADLDHWVSAVDFTGALTVVGRARGRFGSPIVAFDADGDGRTDLFLPSAVVGTAGVRDALLLNRGDGTFEDMTLRLGLAKERASLGAAAGDFDADGRVDLFLTGIGDNRLFHNDGPNGFRDVTKAAGITNPPALSLTARWLDLDQDGDLDLYVINFTGIDHLDQAFTDHTPPGFSNAAYRNDGKPKPVAGLPQGDWAPPAVAKDPQRASSGMSIAFTPWKGSEAILGGDSAHTGLAVLDLALKQA
jgi:hypothetical protein